MDVPDDVTINPHEGMIDPCLISSWPKNVSKYEYWSQLCLKNIDEIREIHWNDDNTGQ
jgi:hypothetical protein